MKREKLSDDQIVAGMASLAEFRGWEVHNGSLVKEFRFPAYLDGVHFAIRVAERAEMMDHHPDLTISWRKVLFRVTTHSAQGLTALDFELAWRVEGLMKQASAGQM